MTIACADCGRTQSIPELPPGATAECVRCDRMLARHVATGTGGTLACAIALLIVLPPAVFLPLMDSTIKNLVFQESRLVSSVSVIYTEVWFPFAFGFLFFAFLLPAVRAALEVIVLASLQWNWRVPQRGRLFRWSEEVRIWSMTEVVVIAGVVAYYRASIPATVVVRIGAWCYLMVAALAFVGDRLLDRREVWNAILPDATLETHGDVASCSVCEMVDVERQAGDPCPRCGHTLDANNTRRYIVAVAAVLAAIPLFFPAYTAAVIINDQITAVLEQTVIGTVQLLAERGYWQYGVIVLIAGVAVPVVEVLGLLWLLARVQWPTRKGLVLRTRAYRLLHRLVRWPLVIPFVAAIAAPIVKYPGIDNIWAGPGATPLFMLLALLMLAVRMFEPRLMWNRAGEAR